jgi:hypothetical protein
MHCMEGSFQGSGGDDSHLSDQIKRENYNKLGSWLHTIDLAVRMLIWPVMSIRAVDISPTGEFIIHIIA